MAGDIAKLDEQPKRCSLAAMVDTPFRKKPIWKLQNFGHSISAIFHVICRKS